ncbi:hypothetical protein AKJ37_04230 [candidate division MSBL1 archaeon SCGC-AAA259I09]|uniref:Uncharacterized protein n=1 Tax=candidate division MSBL1 archaeon SCGC-AAA259I09 TaxID=1698267 RepID=A0A133URV4_9EURY|nr:hypothetical protein AKJ37_04230 [candidate division MSBL1 archaeon SCGC-AAA259I09]
MKKENAEKEHQRTLEKIEREKEKAIEEAEEHVAEVGNRLVKKVKERAERWAEEKENRRIRVMALGTKIGKLKREAKLAEWDRSILFDIEEKDDRWIREALKELRVERSRRKKTECFEGARPGETGEAVVAVPVGERRKPRRAILSIPNFTIFILMMNYGWVFRHDAIVFQLPFL